MKNLNKLSTKRSKADRWYIPTVLVLSFSGFVDATYLTISHFRGTSLLCNLSNGCDQVTNSAYSTMLGLPVALLGLIFYLAVFILMIAYLDIRKEFLAKTVFWLSIISFCFSLWFVTIMTFILKAFCQYCLVSASISSVLFIVNLIWHRLGRIVD